MENTKLKELIQLNTKATINGMKKGKLVENSVWDQSYGSNTKYDLLPTLAKLFISTEGKEEMGIEEAVDKKWEEIMPDTLHIEEPKWINDGAMIYNFAQNLLHQVWRNGAGLRGIGQKTLERMEDFAKENEEELIKEIKEVWN